MNETIRQPQQQTSAVSAPIIRVSGRDREFLPAALEIMETPPAPMRLAVMATLCTFLGMALLWSFFGRLEVHAVANGKIEATGRSKVIQPLDPGKVLAVTVTTGQKVKQGDLLIAFDATEVQADEQALADALLAGRAELARRAVALENVSENSVNPSAVIPWESDIPQQMQRRENAILRADLRQLLDALFYTDREIDQRRTTKARLSASIDFQSKLVKTLEERLEVRETLLRRESGTKSTVLDALEIVQRAQSQLASDKGQLDENDAAIALLSSQKIRTVSQFVADYEIKRGDLARRGDELAQQLAKARARMARTKIFSPIDGTVQQLAVTTLGQVVTTGQQLMLIVPSDSDLYVEAFVGNGDIGFLALGQEVAIKVDSFPFTRYGTLQGRVTAIASDAIDEPDARRSQASTLSLMNAANNTTSSSGPQNFVFPVTIALKQKDIEVSGVRVPLSPGMTITAEIKTENRRIIDYILSPLAKTASEALKER